MPDRRLRRAGTARRAARDRAPYVLRRAGAMLRDARLALGLRQSDAAERAGVSQSFWSRIERGVTTAVSVETLAACGAAVGLQLAAFFERAPGSQPPTRHRAPAAPELARRDRGDRRLACGTGGTPRERRPAATQHRRAPDQERCARGRSRRGLGPPPRWRRRDARPGRQGARDPDAARPGVACPGSAPPPPDEPEPGAGAGPRAPDRGALPGVVSRVAEGAHRCGRSHAERRRIRVDQRGRRPTDRGAAPVTRSKAWQADDVRAGPNSSA